MEAIFLKALNMSITAGWLVLAVVVLRLVLYRAPKYIICVMWGLVALRLICPVSIESPVSIIPSADPLPQDIIYSASPEINSGLDAIDAIVNPALLNSLSPTLGDSANPTQIWSFLLSRIWAIGTIAMLLYALISYLVLRRRVSTATIFDQNIRQSETVQTPFILGIFRPIIYLPYTLESADLEHVIAHEKAHIARLDHIWKPVGFILLSVYWFNPLMWVAYILLCRDIEAACDQKVIAQMETSQRKAYSTALLHFSTHRRTVSASPLSFGEIGAKKRIKSVMNYKKPAFWVVCLAVVAVFALAVCMLTNPVIKGQNSANGDYDICKITLFSSTQNSGQNTESFGLTPFNLEFALPKGWYTVPGDAPSDEIFLSNTIPSRVNIFDTDGHCVGKVGYSSFEYDDSVQDYKMYIYNQIALGNDYRFDIKNSYSVVAQTDQGETAITEVYYSPVMTENGQEKINFGIVSFDKGKSVYVALEFDSDFITYEQISYIAQSLEFED